MKQKLCRFCEHMKGYGNEGSSQCEYNLAGLGPELCGKYELAELYEGKDPSPEELALELPSGKEMKATTMEIKTDDNMALIRIKPDMDKGVLKLYEESRQLLGYANAREIGNESQVKEATDDLAIIAGVKKAIEEKRVSYTGPINDHLKSVNQAFQAFTAPLLQADRLNRDKVGEYRKALEARRQEEERINRLRVEAAQAEMELNGELTESVPVIETAPAPRITRTDMGSAGTVDHWKAEVIDFALLPDEYKLPNMQMLNSAARTYKDKRTIPGVRIFNQPEIRVTTRKGGF